MTVLSSNAVQRQARLIRLMSTLGSGAVRSAEQLAKELSVCRRTIFRDLRLLRAAGLPVVFEESLGGYFLESEAATARPNLRGDDLVPLLMAARLSWLGWIPELAGPLDRAAGKLLHACPAEIRQDCTRLLAACRLVSPDPQRVEHAARWIAPLLNAVRQRRRVLVWFDERDGTQWTHFAPYALELNGDGGRVLGRSSHHRCVVDLDLASIRTLQLTDQRYAIPRQHRSA